MKLDLINNPITTARLCGAIAALPPVEWPWWHRYTGPTGEKYASTDPARLPSAVIRALDGMAEALEGFLPRGSFWDHDLHGAGVHMMPPGSSLGRHVDAVRHPVRPWIRTTSAVLFLRTLDGPDPGGELYLEDGDDAVEVLPEAGKAAVFATEGQWHGVREIAQDAGWRLTLALFGWRQALPNEAVSGQTAAVFQERPVVRLTPGTIVNF